MDTKRILELRRRTGVGFADCQRALEHARGDLEAAVTFLRQQGSLKAAKKISERTAAQGVIAAYVHAGGTIGAMAEVKCETDFVARNQDFLQFAHAVAMHVAAADPQYLAAADVPAEMVERERAIYREQTRQAGKSAAVAEKIVAGKLEQFFKDHCLLEQPYIKDETRTVRQLVEEQVAKLGEKIAITRFARFHI